MTAEKGNISINSENIFPIIKKWLYSDKDIFIRELVSNCCDAITKRRKLYSLAQLDGDEPEYRVTITCDEEAGTLSFTDNGIGMTADEVRRYINQVAFSSAQEFITKYASDKDDGQIIGHFGLGFYSAFMVAKEVRILTLSCQPGAQGVEWSCDGSTNYEMQDADTPEVGTTVTIVLSDEEKEYWTTYKVQEVLSKYCAFLPYPIHLEHAGEHAEHDHDEEDEEEEEHSHTHSHGQINDTNPLWMRTPSEVTEDDYKAFYHKVFTDMNDPLFWIHLNVDYPFRLQGILYFPRLSNQFDSMEGQIKLFNNQVFVADNIKEVIPEFLMMLKGVVDCPDLPLNVSRSFLQNDRDVQKIPGYIVRKVSDRLVGMSKNSHDDYVSYWKDISIFIKYACMRSDQFYEAMKDHLLYESIDGGYVTLNEHLEGETPDKAGACKVYYASNPGQQAATIKMFKDNGLKGIIMDSPIDPHFLSFIEYKKTDVLFARMDSELPDALKGDETLTDSEKEQLTSAMRDAAGKDALKVEFEAIRAQDSAAVIQQNEFMRRYQEMSLGGGMPFPALSEDDNMTLVINAASPLVRSLAQLLAEGREEELTGLLCRQIYDMARLSAGVMPQEDMAEFLARSTRAAAMLAQK